VDEMKNSQVNEDQQKMTWGEFWTLFGIIAGAIGGITLLCLITFRVFWVTHVDNYELAFVFDSATGKIEKVDKTGWIVRTPVRYSVHHIDLRPHQLTISANQRVLNAKLVQFDPEGLDTFVQWHGRAAGDETKALQEILKCYAFDLADGKDCPFLKVVQEIAPSQAGTKVAGKTEAEKGK
jgi:hypothetical protein